MTRVRLTHRSADLARRAALPLLAGALLLGFSPAASAATIPVQTEDDAIGDDGRCSLREAITAANSDAGAGGCPAGAGADTISLPAGFYELSIAGGDEDANATGDLDVTSDMTIQGAGATRTFVDGAQLDRVLDVAAVTAAVEGVTISGGRPPTRPAAGPGFGGNGADGNPGGAGGAGFGGPGAAGGNGGGIRNAGTLTITGSVIADNNAGAGGAGGAGFGGFGGNGASGGAGGSGADGFGGFGGIGGQGGGIFNSGTLTLSESSVRSNRAGTGGEGGAGFGGFGGSGHTNAGGGVGGNGFGGFGGAGGSGGGLAGTGSVTVSESTISGNSTGEGGVGAAGFGGFGGSGAGSGTGGQGGLGFGGFGSSGGSGGGGSVGTATIASSTIAANRARPGAAGGPGFGGFGGPGGATGNGGAGGEGFGGFGASGGSTGGLARGAATATNVTVDGNAAGDAGAGGAGFGGFGGSGGSTSGNGGAGAAGFGGFGGSGGASGGLAGTGSLTLSHGTVTNNHPGAGAGAGPGFGGTGGASPGAPGSDGSSGTGFAGFAGADGTGAGITGTKTLKNTIASDNQPTNCTGANTNAGGNISFPTPTCPGSNVDPELGELADNGGPTDTRRLRRGSPAIDAVPSGSSEPTDQRGVARPQGAEGDAGAYEVAPPNAATGGATGVSDTGATLTGDVTANARDTIYKFEYGTTTDYGSDTPSQDAGAGTSPSPVSAAVTGLAPETTYHFRIVAANAEGVTRGADQTFTTGATPPLAGQQQQQADTTRPALSSLSLTNRIFRVGPRPTVIAAAAKRGTTFRYTSSEAASVSFVIQRGRKGRRRGSRCVKPTPALRRARKCTRYKTAGALTRSAIAGANTLVFSGRIGTKALRPGRYRAVLTATDAAGNKSAARRISFRIVKR